MRERWLRFWRARGPCGRWVRPSEDVLAAVRRATLDAMLADPDPAIRQAAAGIARRLAARGALEGLPALEPRPDAGGPPRAA